MGDANDPEAALEPFFPFVRLEFPFALGPPAGRFIVAGETSRDEFDDRGRSFATSDVLTVAVIGRPVTSRRSLGKVRRQFSRPAPAAVPLACATVIQATVPLQHETDAEAQMQRWRTDEAARRAHVDGALAVLNVAIRAHAAATADPYVGEVVVEDARSVAMGYGTGPELTSGRWTSVYDVRWGQIDGDHSALIGDVLGGRRAVPGASRHLARAYHDARAGRTRLCLEELRCARDLSEDPEMVPAAVDAEAIAVALSRSLRPMVAPRPTA